jgi:hypothetical protein
VLLQLIGIVGDEHADRVLVQTLLGVLLLHILVGVLAVIRGMPFLQGALAVTSCFGGCC